MARKDTTLKIGRIGAGAAALALAGLVVAGPASADTPEVYVGSATGTALNLSVLGQSLTLGTSKANISSQLTAIADAAGQAAPVATAAQHSEANTGAPTDSKPNACAGPTVPDPIKAILDVGLVCSTTSASVAGNNPTASGQGSVASVTMGANTVLQQIPVTQPLLDALQPVVGQIPGGVGQTLNSVITSVFNTQTLNLTVAPTTSSVVTDAGKVTSTSTAAGAVLKLLPAPTVNGTPTTDPIATITVGSAKASAVYDRAAGTATPTVDPAIVRVEFNQGLGLPSQSVPVGQSLTILQGTPLETTITVAAGTTAKNTDGSVSAIADGVSIQALKGVNGGIVLQLAHAEAGVGGTAATVTPPAPPAAAPASELPRTGGTPWVPIAGAGLLGLAFVARSLRRLRQD